MLRERITLFLFISVSLFFCIESWRLGVGSFKKPGVGFLPFVVSLAIGLLAIILLLKSVGRGHVKSAEPFFQREGVRKIIYMLCFLFAYPLLMNQLGFFLCTLLFVVLSLRVIEPQKWRVVILVSIGVTIISYLLFDVWLYVQFPEGRWVNQLLTTMERHLGK